MTDASLPKGGPARPYGNFLLTGIEAEVVDAFCAIGCGTTGNQLKNAFVDDQAYGINARALFGKEPGDVATDIVGVVRQRE